MALPGLPTVTWSCCRLAVVVGLVWLPPVATAQERSSPIQDLLQVGRSSLYALRYAEADSVARAVLDVPRLRRAERIQALQLSAGALFPEHAEHRQPREAVARLAELIRISPNAGLPGEFTWSGLDSLYRVVYQQVFGANAVPPASAVLVGQEGVALIPVVATRPATWRLTVRRLDEERETVVDSIPLAERGGLRFTVLDGTTPRIRSGRHVLRVSAVDPITEESLTLAFEAEVDAPPLELLPLPPAFDSTRLLSEVTRPKRAGGIVAGVLVGAATITASGLVRDGELRSLASSDSRAVTLGVMLGIGTGAGVWLLDKGAPIPKNVAANEQMRSEYLANQAAVRAENQGRVASYRAVLLIQQEVP